MIKVMKKIVSITSLLMLIFLNFPVALLASEINIRPFLIDEILEPRDSITKSITLTNKYETRKAVLYATVNEITVDSTGEIKEFISPVMTDRTNTVTSWIEVSRGRIELNPSEVVEVPLTINIHPYAQPGEYHVFIGFVEAAKRYEAENIAMSGDADGVIVKITVADKREDVMRISGFTVNRFVTGDNSRTISVEVENSGDLPSAPTGEIIFYNSHGAEVMSIPVNTDGKEILPGESAVLENLIPLEDSLGRFKANVSLHYGENQKAELFDTTFFYLMPANLLLLVFGGILLVAIITALLLRRSLVREYVNDNMDDVTMFVRDGYETQPKEHDINLKKDN
jgi:hypothetical protein